MTTQTSCNNSFLKDLTTFSHNRTYNNSPWPTSPNLAVIPNFGLPMRNYAIKTRATAGDIKSLQLITAVNTPYLQDKKNIGKIDFEAYDALVNRQINDGADGIIVGDAIGKRPLMNKDEHTELIRHTVNCFGSKIKVIANTGSNSTRDAIGDTEEGFAAGMHAALHTNPINLNTSLAGVKVHFENLLSIGPTIIYNVPSITGQDIPPDVICSIAAPGDHNSNFLGVIECAGNKRIKEYTDKEIVVWSGNDVECHDSRWEYGATGVISVTSNLVPGLMKQLMIDGKNPTLNSKLSPLMEWLYSEPNYIGMITALAQLGVAKPVFRGPYDPFPLEKRRKFVELVNKIGRKNFVGDKDVEVLDDSDFIMV